MGIVSFLLGIISLIILGIGLFGSLDVLIWAVAALALAALVFGLTALSRRQQRFYAWIGVICSGLAIVSASITYGIDHGLG